MTLIALNGRRGSGKDTAYSFIHQWCEERGVSVGRRGFADALKLSFARIFIPSASIDEAVVWCDILKQEGHFSVEWGGEDKQPGQKTLVRHEMTGRLMLQRYGTEAHRDVFGDNFWVDVLLPLTSFHDDLEGLQNTWPRNFMGQLDQYPPQICVITDCRFENEAERVKELGGKIWEVHRGGQQHDDQHQSEVPLPSYLIDQTIYNNAEGNLTEFQAQLATELERLVEE
jgi:hypothetical protein